MARESYDFTKPSNTTNILLVSSCNLQLLSVPVVVTWMRRKREFVGTRILIFAIRAVCRSWCRSTETNKYLLCGTRVFLVRLVAKQYSDRHWLLYIRWGQYAVVRKTTNRTKKTTDIWMTYVRVRISIRNRYFRCSEIINSHLDEIVFPYIRRPAFFTTLRDDNDRGKRNDNDDVARITKIRLKSSARLGFFFDVVVIIIIISSLPAVERRPVLVLSSSARALHRCRVTGRSVLSA